MNVLIALTSIVLFASCMHMGMQMDGSHQGHQEGDVLLEKAVTSGDIKAVATYPPMVTGREQVFTLRLVNKATGEPVTGAEVYFHAVPVRGDRSGSQDTEHHHAEGEGGNEITRDAVEEKDEPGTYAVSYGAPEPGARELTFHVASVGSEKLDPALVIQARRVVADAAMDPTGGMMMQPGRSTSTYFIIGGVLMAAMMAVMLIR